MEELLRRIRQQYYKVSVHTRSKLKKMLSGATLEDFRDISSYVAYIKAVIHRLSVVGYKVQEEDKLYHLLEGLPNEYGPVKQAIKMPRENPLTWQQTVDQLEDFAQDPTVPGSLNRTSSKKADQAHAALDRRGNKREVCRDYLRGRCNRGSRCPRIHLDGEEARENYFSERRKNIKCFNCGKHGHMARDCPERTNEQRESKQRGDKQRLAGRPRLHDCRRKRERHDTGRHQDGRRRIHRDLRRGHERS